MSRAVVARAFVLLSIAALAAPSRALAQEPVEASGAATAEAASARSGRSSTVLTPSVLASYGAGASDELGVGLQLRLDHYPTQYGIRIGGFVQAEVQTDGSVRIAGGLANAMWLFGCEIGLAYRTDTGHYASSLGLHLGKSILLGPVSIGGRVTIPLVDFLPAQGDAMRVQGIEGAVVLTVGLPTTLDGPDRSAFDCSHGARRGHDHDEADASE